MHLRPFTNKLGQFAAELTRYSSFTRNKFQKRCGTSILYMFSGSRVTFLAVSLRVPHFSASTCVFYGRLPNSERNASTWTDAMDSSSAAKPAIAVTLNPAKRQRKALLSRSTYAFCKRNSKRIRQRSVTISAAYPGEILGGTMATVEASARNPSVSTRTS